MFSVARITRRLLTAAGCIRFRVRIMASAALAGTIMARHRAGTRRVGRDAAGSGAHRGMRDRFTSSWGNSRAKSPDSHLRENDEQPLVQSFPRRRESRGRCPSTDARRGRAPAAVIALVALAAPAPGASQLPGTAPEVALTLDETVRLALRTNRTLISARRRRDVERYALEVSGDRYRPRASVGASVGDGDTIDPTAELSAGPSLRIPTGGELSLSWSHPLAEGGDRDGTWRLGFSQPLLKGFGTEVDAAPLRIAQIGEKENALSFADTVSRVVVSVITAYRSVIRAHHAITIAHESLARAERQLEVNRSLIDAGRLAAREIVQTEVEVANRKLALVESENDLNSADASLVSLLDVDGVTSVRPALELPPVEPVPLDRERGIETALAHRTDYLRALLSREEAEIGLELARDERRWDLMLSAHVSRTGARREDFGTGLALSVPLGDRAPQLAALRAKNTLRSRNHGLYCPLTTPTRASDSRCRRLRGSGAVQWFRGPSGRSPSRPRLDRDLSFAPGTPSALGYHVAIELQAQAGIGGFQHPSPGCAQHHRHASLVGNHAARNPSRARSRPFLKHTSGAELV